MKVIVAVDSFKGSMTSLEAGTAIKNGILRVKKDADIEVIPVADGGEGTVEALTYGKHNIQQKPCMVTDPLGGSIEAGYIMYETMQGKTAIMEIASAAGLVQIPENKRNPLYTTSYGVGEMMKAAMKEGCRRFILGLGGSGTNDGGIGMLQALGYHFVDEKGNEVPYGAIGLEKTADIYFEEVIPEVRNCTFQVICDVTNPLTGDTGCSAVFAPQKGADAPAIERMERAMERYANLVEHMASCDAGPIRANGNRRTAGVGAAGGMGYAYQMFLNATLRSGIETILEELQFQERIKGADCVITGEGRMDAQTLMGKTPAGIAKMAKQLQIPVIAFAGCFGEGIEACKKSRLFDACFSVSEELYAKKSSDSNYMQKSVAMHNLEECVANVFPHVRVNEINNIK